MREKQRERNIERKRESEGKRLCVWCEIKNERLRYTKRDGDTHRERERQRQK